MSIIQRVPWTVQPQGAVDVDWGNPLNIGLASTVLASAGKRDIVRNVALTGDCGIATYKDGRYLSFNGAQYLNLGYSTGFGAFLGNTTGSYSVTVKFFTSIATTTRQTVIGDWDSGGANDSVDISFSGFGGTSGDVTTYRAPASVGVSGTATLSRVIATVVNNVSANTLTIHVSSNDRYLGSASAASISVPGVSANLGRTGDFTSIYLSGGIELYAGHRRALSFAEVLSLHARPYQIFEPLARRIWAPVSAGGGTDGNASTTPAGSTLTAPTATGSGSAQATTAPAGSTLTAPTAAASASAQASGALAGVSLTAPTATATGTTAGNATATGAPAGLTLTAPTATASGSAQASSALAGATLTAPTGTASSAGHAIASGAPAGLTMTAPTASATGSAQAFAAFMATVLTAPTATASNGEEAPVLGSLAGSARRIGPTRSNKQTATRSNRQTATR